MSAKRHDLSDSERQFVAEYLIDRNGVRAYRAVHGQDVGYFVAGQMAHRWLKKAKIRAEIDAADAALRRRCRVSADRVVREIAAVAFADIGDHLDYAADGLPQMKPGRAVSATARKSLKKIKIKKRRIRSKDNDADGIIEEVEEAEIELHDKLAALDKLAKHLGLFKDEPAIVAMLRQLPPDLRAQVAAALGLETFGISERPADPAPAPVPPSTAEPPPDEPPPAGG